MWGAKTSNFGPLFPRLPQSTPRISRTKRRMNKQKATVNLQCVPYKMTYFPWPLTQKRLRCVCLLWRNIRRPLRCNHQSCDISILFYFILLLRLRNGFRSIVVRVSVCMYVCLFVGTFAYLRTTRQNFTTFSLHVTCGSVQLWRQWVQRTYVIYSTLFAVEQYSSKKNRWK